MTTAEDIDTIKEKLTEIRTRASFMATEFSEGERMEDEAMINSAIDVCLAALDRLDEQKEPKP
jgi:hypothetical protein